MEKKAKGEVTVLTQISFEFIKTNGITLHTAVAGPEEGPLVLLLHGFPEFWYGWRYQIGPLAERGYRVVVPDQRGYNLSDKPEGPEQYTLDRMRDDAIGIIRHFDRTSATVIGHDWGGAVGWHLAASRPEWIEKLLVLNMPHPRIFPRVMLKRPSQAVRSSYIAFFQLPNIPETMLTARGMRGLKAGLVRTSRKGTFSPAALEQYEEAWGQPGAVTAMLNWYRAIPKGSLQQVPNLPIKVPVRLIWGAGDQFLSIALAKKSLEMCEDGEGVFVGDVTHWLLHEQPETVNQLIHAFLEREEPETL